MFSKKKHNAENNKIGKNDNIANYFAIYNKS